jgi:hypothetical protein
MTDARIQNLNGLSIAEPARHHQMVRVGEVSALKRRPTRRNKGAWVTHGRG